MQTTAAVAAAAFTPAAADRPMDRYVVRPAGVLADILGAAEFREDELLLKLRELGLITYPSPLLGPLLEEWSDVLAVEVLARLDPTDVVVFGQAAHACRAAVVAFGVPQEEFETSDNSDNEGTGAGDESSEPGPLLLRVQDFVGSVERLAWAKARSGPWNAFVCAFAARYGHLEVLKWAWERRCPWNEETCAAAATHGQLSALRWAREHDCPWDTRVCAAVGVGLRLLRVGRLHVPTRR